MASRAFLRSPAARIIASGAAALLVAEAAVLLLSPAQAGPEPLPVEAAAYLDPARVAEAEEYASGQRLIGLGLILLEIAALVAFALGRPRALDRALARLERKRRLGAFAAGAMLSVALTLIAVPGGLVAHERAVDVGLSTQELGSWLGDRVRGLAIGAVYAALGALILVGLQRLLPRAWWLAAAGVVTTFALVVSFLAPVVIAPIFNDFEELERGPLRADVLALAGAADVEVDDVLVVDASRRGTSLNAYVAGVGSTRRVVLYDNLVAEADRPALRSVVAHELAHVRDRDIPRGILFVALVAPLGMLFVAEFGGVLARRSGGPGRVRSIPAYALALTVSALAIGIVSNQLSRAVEERADRTAIELTGDPEGLIALQVAIAERNLSDPDPPTWSRILFGTHPDKLERIGLAEAYRAAGP